MAEELLTIKEIARRLNLAESTCRYFRDKWPEYMPAVKVGRRTFYQAEAIEVLRVIADETQKRRNAAETQNLLNSMFARNIEQNAETQSSRAAEQQNHLIPVNSDIKLIKALREEIFYLREQNRLLTNKLLQLHAPAKPSWQRIFKRKD